MYSVVLLGSVILWHRLQVTLQTDLFVATQLLTAGQGYFSQLLFKRVLLETPTDLSKSNANYSSNVSKQKEVTCVQLPRVCDTTPILPYKNFSTSYTKFTTSSIFSMFTLQSCGLKPIENNLCLTAQAEKWKSGSLAYICDAGYKSHQREVHRCIFYATSILIYW